MKEIIQTENQKDCNDDQLVWDTLSTVLALNNSKIMELSLQGYHPPFNSGDHKSRMEILKDGAGGFQTSESYKNISRSIQLLKKNLGLKQSLNKVRKSSRKKENVGSLPKVKEYTLNDLIIMKSSVSLCRNIQKLI